MKYLNRGLVLLCLWLLSLGLSAQDRAAAILSHFQHPSDDYIMVISHRGDWRYAPENSLAAIQRCMDLGVDVVEIDVRLTRDGHLILMHDETVDRTTNGRGLVAEMTLAQVKALRLKNACGSQGSRQQVPTLEEAMTLAKDKIMVNLDKVEGKTLQEAFEVLVRTGTVDQAILKGRVPAAEMRRKYGGLLDSVVYMPIVWHDLPDAASYMTEWKTEVNPVAYEMLFSSEDSPNLAAARRLQEQGVTFLAIALWDELVAGHTDEMALLEGPDAAWGWLVQQGARAIMTDRPAELLAYLQSKGLR